LGSPAAKTGMVAWHSVGRSSSCYLSWCWTQGRIIIFKLWAFSMPQWHQFIFMYCFLSQFKAVMSECIHT